MEPMTTNYGGLCYYGNPIKLTKEIHTREIKKKYNI